MNLPSSSRQRRRRRQWSPAMVCIYRGIVVYTGVVFVGLLWGFRRFGLPNFNELQPMENINHKILPGIGNEPRDDNTRPWEIGLYGPLKWIKESQQMITTGATEFEKLDTPGIRPRDTNPAHDDPDGHSVHQRASKYSLLDRNKSEPKGRDGNVVEAQDQMWSRSGSGQRSLCRGFDHSIYRPRHGCQVNKDTHIVYCNFENLRIDTAKMDMVARGGESLSEVMGRDEKDEFPTYQRGAFTTPEKPKYEVPNEYRKHLHYLENVLNAMKVKKATCQKTYPGTTLFITRYEYVNLFHTLTDWWNTFFVLPRTSQGNNFDNDDILSGSEGIARPDRVVFLDGHAQGILDPVWKAVFGEYYFIKDMAEATGSEICFERAIFVPAGYDSQLFDEFSKTVCPHKGMTRSFSNFVLERYNLLQDPKVKVIKGNIVLIDRQPFVSHPRSDANKLNRRFVDSDLEKLQTRLKEIPGTSVRSVRFETMSFGEQLKLLRETHVLVGIHGAALSHILFMDEKRSHSIEFQPYTRLKFFEHLSKWRGIDHTTIDLDYDDGLTDAGIDETVQLVKKFMRV